VLRRNISQQQHGRDRRLRKVARSSPGLFPQHRH
jgi:hypothetical protein